MTELFSRPPNRPDIHNHLARRIILITSGIPVQAVLDAIFNWNKKLPLPIGLFDGHRSANMINDDHYDSNTVEDFIVKPDGY